MGNRIKLGREIAWLVAFVFLISMPAVTEARESDDPTVSHGPFSNSVDSEGTVHTLPLTIPLTPLESAEARQLFLQDLTRVLPRFSGDVVTFRREMNEQAYAPRVAHLRALFPVSIEEKTIAGVETDIIVPEGGIAKKNLDRVLINLHGGAFMFGAHLGGQLESIRIAHDGRIKIITVDYREGPESHFPAASEDVAAVYRELLKHYKPQNIGIYGCSAGGMLTAESVAWFQNHGLPRPGAVGIFCSGAGPGLGGYSATIAPALNGTSPPVEEINSSNAQDAVYAEARNAPYFAGADFTDPIVSPVESLQVLSKFPPTLILTGTRDNALSAAVHSHALLVKAGVDTELHVWEGIGHGEFLNPDIPEGAEAASVIVRFFDRHLGH